MKQLLLIVATLATVVSTQAASFQWSVDERTWQCLPGDSESYFTGTAYLFDLAAVTQQQVIDAGADFASLGYLQTLTLNDGEASGYSSTFSWGSAGDTLTAFYATLFNDGKDDYIFISPTGSGLAGDVGTTAILINNVAGPSANPAFESTTYQGPGWYPTPEPTSGLLVLIGMASLMLKRKRI